MDVRVPPEGNERVLPTVRCGLLEDVLCRTPLLARSAGAILVIHGTRTRTRTTTVSLIGDCETLKSRSKRSERCCQTGLRSFLRAVIVLKLKKLDKFVSAEGVADLDFEIAIENPDASADAEDVVEPLYSAAVEGWRLTRGL